MLAENGLFGGLIKGFVVIIGLLFQFEILLCEASFILDLVEEPVNIGLALS